MQNITAITQTGEGSAGAISIGGAVTITGAQVFSSTVEFDGKVTFPSAIAGACILAGASTSSPITYTGTSTVNIVEVNAKHSGASGVLRGVLSYVENSGTNVGGTTNLYGVRGYACVSGTFASATAFGMGLQGKVELSGTITDGRLAAVLAQINSSAGTFTAGEMACLWCDLQLTNAQMAGMTTAFKDNFSMIKLSSNAGTTGGPQQMIDMYGYANYAFRFGATGGGWCSSAGAVTTNAGYIKVSCGGDRYIQLMSAAP